MKEFLKIWMKYFKWAALIVLAIALFVVPEFLIISWFPNVDKQIIFVIIYAIIYLVTGYSFITWNKNIPE